MSKEEDIIDRLVLSGGLEAAGVDSENGELLYTFTPKIKEIMPELYNEHLNDVNSEVMALWEAGYLDLDFMSDDPVITLSDKAFDELEIKKLSKRRQWSLDEIKRLLII